MIPLQQVHHRSYNCCISKQDLYWDSHAITAVAVVSAFGGGQHRLSDSEITAPLGDGGAWRALGPSRFDCVCDELRKHRLAQAAGLEELGQRGECGRCMGFFAPTQCRSLKELARSWVTSAIGCPVSATRSTKDLQRDRACHRRLAREGGSIGEEVMGSGPSTATTKKVGDTDVCQQSCMQHVDVQRGGEGGGYRRFQFFLTWPPSFAHPSPL